MANIERFWCGIKTAFQRDGFGRLFIVGQIAMTLIFVGGLSLISSKIERHSKAFEAKIDQRSTAIDRELKELNERAKNAPANYIPYMSQQVQLLERLLTHQIEQNRLLRKEVAELANIMRQLQVVNRVPK